jgi:hypothetical protein
VPNLEFEECPNCGERLYDHDAMRKIEEHSPAYAKRRAAEKVKARGRSLEPSGNQRGDRWSDRRRTQIPLTGA